MPSGDWHRPAQTSACLGGDGDEISARLGEQEAFLSRAKIQFTLKMPAGLSSARAEFFLRYGLIIKSRTLLKCHTEVLSDIL